MGRRFFYGTIQQKRNENGTIYLKARILEWNQTISKKSNEPSPTQGPGEIQLVRLTHRKLDRLTMKLR